jgi:hypothetical protein
MPHFETLRIDAAMGGTQRPHDEVDAPPATLRVPNNESERTPVTFTSPETRFLATRLWALDLVLRGMCMADPNMARRATIAVDAFEHATLFGDIPDATREAITEYARRVINGAPG